MASPIVPRTLAEALSCLAAGCPAGVPATRWQACLDDAAVFLGVWEAQAEALGWRADELFGLHPSAPLARYDRMGLLWLMRGRRVIELTASAARLSNGMTYRRVERIST